MEKLTRREKLAILAIKYALKILKKKFKYKSPELRFIKDDVNIIVIGDGDRGKKKEKTN